MLALFVKQPRLQGRGARLLGIAEVAHEAEVGHHRREPFVEALRPDPHHVELAAHEPVGGDPVGMETAEVVARADHDGLGLDWTAARLEAGRRRRADRPYPRRKVTPCRSSR